MCFDVILKIFFCIRRHGLHLVSDIDLAGHRFGDEGLTVFFEEFNFLPFCGYQFVNLLSLVVEEVGDLGLFSIRMERDILTRINAVLLMLSLVASKINRGVIVLRKDCRMYEIE